MKKTPKTSSAAVYLREAHAHIQELESQLATLRATAEITKTRLEYLRDRGLNVSIELDALRAALDATPTTVDPRVTRLIEAAERMIHWTIGITDSECRDIVGAMHAVVKDLK